MCKPYTVMPPVSVGIVDQLLDVEQIDNPGLCVLMFKKKIYFIGLKSFVKILYLWLWKKIFVIPNVPLAG